MNAVSVCITHEWSAQAVLKIASRTFPLFATPWDPAITHSDVVSVALTSPEGCGYECAQQRLKKKKKKPALQFPVWPCDGESSLSPVSSFAKWRLWNNAYSLGLF